MQKERSFAEVYNDQWDIVVNVFRVLRDETKAQDLRKRVELTPYSRTEFEQTGDEYLNQIEDPVERARRTIFRSFAGFGSAATNAKHATGFRANNNRAGTTPAHDWVNYPFQIGKFIQRLQGVVIENRPAVEVLIQHDRHDTLHYVDPPYVHETRNLRRGNAAYAHEMTNQDHNELSKVLYELKGMVVLSGYDSSLYNDIYSDWPQVRKKVYADGAAERIETLWMNRACEAAQVQSKLFV